MRFFAWLKGLFKETPKAGDALVVLGAARLGSTRLIDNFEI